MDELFSIKINEQCASKNIFFFGILVLTLIL